MEQATKDEEYVEAPGRSNEQARPTCFGDGQLQIPDRSGSDRLCSTCTSLEHLESTLWDSIDNFQEVIVKHHRSVNALIESARGGCHFCGLLLIAWEERCRLDQEPEGGWVGKKVRHSVSLDDDITFKIQKERISGAKERVVTITILCGDLPPFMVGELICKPMDTSLRTFPETCLPIGSDTNTGSSASLSRIKAWLDICTSSHPACSQADTQPPPLPTRVIAVGRKGSSRCYLVSGKEKNGYYATLSHCWGDPNHRPLTTTDQTLACRQQGIENEELPKTFQHAVEVCRQMGIDYLWIDSLCIIQDQESQEDWAKEAPRMGFVYGNSTLTISAAAAADSTQGCFQERFGLFFWPSPVVMFGRACYISRYPTYKEWFYSDLGDLDESIPLAQRAWVLQEQVLSRRSIAFSKPHLVWRCATLSTNEKFPLGMLHMPSILDDNLRLLHCIINGMTSLIPKSLHVDIYTCWYKLVQDFTSRSLTYNGDRLPAIAGIAKRFGMSANDSYHAGLWRRDLIYGLLWRVTIYVGHVTRSAIAPSWSWASIDRAVDYERFSRGYKHQRSLSSPLVDILDILDPATCEDHPFGATSKASLRLSGILLEMVEDGHEDFVLALTGSGTYLRSDRNDLDLDVKDADRPAGITWLCLPVCVRHGDFTDDISYSKMYKSSWEKSLKTGKDELEHKQVIYCLVLQPVEGEQDTYSRLGLYYISEDKTTETSKTTEISRMAFEERRPLTIV